MDIKFSRTKDNRIQGGGDSDVFRLPKNQFLRNNNNKGSRSNVNKQHELVNGESSSNARDAR